MGDFAQLNDEDAELLSGGVQPQNPSNVYGGSNYGQYIKSGGTGDNPSKAFTGKNFGQSKK